MVFGLYGLSFVKLKLPQIHDIKYMAEPSGGCHVRVAVTLSGSLRGWLPLMPLAVSAIGNCPLPDGSY